MLVNEKVCRRISPGLLVLAPLICVSSLAIQAGAPATEVANSRQKTADETREPKEPITLRNVDRVGLLSETSRLVNRIERGPGPNELVFHLDDGIEIVDDTTLELVRRVADKYRPGFSYSQDGSKTSWLEGKTAVIRDEKTGEIIRIEAGEEDLGRPVLSPDNKVVVVPEIVVDETGGEGEGSVYLRTFNTATGDLIRKLTIVDGSYGGLTPVFSPDGKTLAVGNRNYRTELYDTATWKRRMVLPRHMTHEIAFSPDGSLLAAAYADGTIALWIVETGEILRTVDSGCSRVQSLDWSPAGDLLATSGPSGTRIAKLSKNKQMPGKVQLWDPKTLGLLKELKSVEHSGSVRFTRDGKRLVARFTREKFPGYETRIAVWSTNAPPQEAESNPVDSKPIQPASNPGSKSAVQDRPSGRVLLQPLSPPPAYSVAWAKDGALLLSYGMRVELSGKPTLFGKYFKIPLDVVSVTNSQGERKTDEQVLELMKKRTAVLVSSNGLDVDPYYLQTAKPDTLVIVIKGYGWRAEMNSSDPQSGPLIKREGDSPEVRKPLK